MDDTRYGPLPTNPCDIVHEFHVPGTPGDVVTPALSEVGIRDGKPMVSRQLLSPNSCCKSMTSAKAAYAPSIASGRACSICWCPYEDHGEREPVALPCGHSYCRTCLLQISSINRLCPKCRVRFTGAVASMPPNYGLQEILETAATQQGQAPQLAPHPLEAKVAEMAAMMAAMQLSMQVRDAAARLGAAEAERQHLNLQAELQRMNAKQQATTHAAPTTTNHIPVPIIGVNNTPIGAYAPKLVPISAYLPVTAPSPPTIITLKSDDLEELFRLAGAAVGPTVINLCGRHLIHNGLGSTTISSSNLTLRNGSIQLSEGPEEKGSSLCVKGTGVEMQGLVIIGGQVGLWVEAGSDVTLRDCEVRCSHIGVWVGVATNPATTASVQHRPSHLSAVRLKVWGTGKGSALAVGGGGAALLDDCEFSAGQSHGILVCGDAPSKLTATNVRCFANGAKGVVVHHGAHVMMYGCRITENKDGSVVVRWKGSKAELVGCVMDESAYAFQGGELEVK